MPELSKLFLQIVQLSLEAGFLVLVVLLLRLVFRSAPKWLHCLMWALVAVKLICPFGIEIEASPMPRSDAVRSSVESTASVSESVGELPEQHPMQQEQPSESHGAGIQSHAAQSQSKPAGSRTILPSAVKIGSWVWLAGMAGILLYAAASTIALRRRLADAVPLDDSTENSDRIYRSDRIQSAFLFGIVRPKIYLPFGIEGENLRQVIAHEKAHLRRLDNVTKAVAFILAAVYWFHPAIWLAYILYCRDIELACDESVVKGKQPDERKAYSMALLECSTEKNAFMINSAIPVQFGQSAVRRRVANVLKSKKPAIWLICVGIVAIVTALIVVITRPTDYRTDVPKELDEAVARSIFTMNGVSMSDITVDGQIRHYAAVGENWEFDRESPYKTECLGEGHEILGYREKDGSVEVYALCGVLEYTFSNGRFEECNGYTCVPTLMIFEKDKDGRYLFRSGKDTAHDEEFRNSIEEIFPKELARIAVNMAGDSEIGASIEIQCLPYAEAYLFKIGRAGTLSVYDDKTYVFSTLEGLGVSDKVATTLFHLHPDYSNCFDENTKAGNIEKVENGVRYVYTVKWDGDNSGKGSVYFTKSEYDSGKIVEKTVYKVEGDKFKRIHID